MDLQGSGVAAEIGEPLEQAADSFRAVLPVEVLGTEVVDLERNPE